MSLCMKCRFVAVTIGWFSINTFVFGQIIPEDKILRYEDMVALLDTTECSLHKIFIDNDTLAAAFRKAGTHYPELCELRISLRYGSGKTSMAARPYFWSLLRKRDRRRYKVIINNDMQKAQARLIYATPFDARVGVMGHELAHILDYSAKSGLQVMWTGICYLGKKYRRTMEHRIDSTAIVRGLGWQLYRYAYFVLHEAQIDDTYRRYKADMYMKPEEIYEMIKDE